MSRLPALMAIAATLLAGCAAPASEIEAASEEAPPESITGPFAVIGFIDDGINPYHLAFRDTSARAFAHPSTYLEGFPTDAIALNITLDAATIEDALLADCELWNTVEPDTLYWFPGTRVVGAIRVSTEYTKFIFSGEPPAYTCDDAKEEDIPVIIFGDGHGTMVASRGAGTEWGACPTCLIVMIQGAGPEHVLYAADQGWIDVQSNSWGPFLPTFLPDGNPAPLLGSNPQLGRAVEDSASRQPAFWATGNGALFRLGVLGHPTQATFHLGPSPIRVGGHDSGRVALWPGSGPHVVSDACWSWAAEHMSIDEWTPRTGGGTSGATPFVAGFAARLVLDARVLLNDTRVGVHEGVLARGEPGAIISGPLADGDLTMAELREALFTTADARPDRIEHDGDVCEATEETLYALYPGLPVEWAQIPEAAPATQLIGYGAVTPETYEAALAILRGEAEPPARPMEAAHFQADDAYRRAVHDALH